MKHFVIAAMLVALSVPNIRAQAAPRHPVVRDSVALLDVPRAWVVPRQDNAGAGHLYVGATVQNRSRVPLLVGLSFRVYRANGDEQSGCFAPGKGGPGVVTELQPGHTAFLFCSRVIVPTAFADDLTVTARTWTERLSGQHRSDVIVVRTELDAPILLHSGNREGAEYNAHATLHTSGSRDVQLAILLRFLTPDNIQVGTCMSDVVVLEPEVDKRVGCWSSGPWLPAGVPLPDHVVAEIRAPN